VENKTINDFIQRLRENSIARVKREGIWRDLLTGYPVWHQNIDSKNNDEDEGKRKFFRIQRGYHDNLERMLPLSTGDEQIGLGRANYEKESLLYCTDMDFYSCLLELVDRTHNDIQRITVIEFTSKSNLSIIPIGLTDRKRYTEILLSNGLKFTEEGFRAYQLISDFMDEEFRLISDIEGRSYLNSSVISKVIREDFPKAHGLRYKTVRGFNFYHRGLNYAFEINNFHDYFEITHCMQQEFRWLENEVRKFDQLGINVGKMNKEGKFEFEKYK